jgi:hypothetical protein
MWIKLQGTVARIPLLVYLLLNTCRGIGRLEDRSSGFERAYGRPHFRAHKLIAVHLWFRRTHYASEGFTASVYQAKRIFDAHGIGHFGNHKSFLPSR